MIRPVLLLSLLLLFVGVVAAPARAQNLPGCKTSKQFKIEQIEKDHWKLTGTVEIDCDTYKIYADEVDVYTALHRVTAQGNVVFTDGTARIAGERADFDTEAKTGTFYVASGSATLGERAKKDMFEGQEPDMYFYGEEVSKIGPDRYKITHGSFTTCLQPTPRWQLVATSMVVHVDHYASLKNTVLKAKVVPVLYLPIVYYPIKKENRATGFLMPSYGLSTIKGFTFSEAFFWAIDRSHDATILYDYFSKQGHGTGAEYRYVSGPGSQGYARFYTLNQRATSTTAAQRSYEIRSNASENLGHGWTARLRIDYFTNITVNQAYNTDIYDASRSTRAYSASVGGNVAGFTLAGSYDRTEYFSGTTDSTVTGGTPRLMFSRGERPLFGSVLYFGLNGEFVNLTRVTTQSDTVTDRSLGRFDLMPTFRLPFTKLRFLTVNTSAAFRETYWTRSQDPTNINVVLNEPINRTYFDLQARITGPVVN